MSASGEGARVPRDRRALIAVDLGAESCRVSLLRWVPGDGSERPEITLVHRFANAPVAHDDGSLRWPFAKIVAGVEAGMRQAADLAPEGIRSVAVDGWAVDYVRLNEQGQPLAEPFCYRDERTVEAERRLHAVIPAERMREITGVQQLRINTLYQLYADRLAGLPAGQGWLNLPESLLARWGGEPVAEYTNATHTQLVDLHTREWSPEIFAAAGLDLARAHRIVPPGTLLGRLQGPLSDLPAFRQTVLIAPACHDTASALAGIPGFGEDWAYISSGTWSLVGTPLRAPLSNAAVREDNFTNFGGAGGNICFHRNVNGMWLIKQCLDSWAAAGADLTLVELLGRAERIGAERFGAAGELLDVDDADLLLVGEMPRRINAQRARRGLPVLDESPANAPTFIALILHSLAARYAEVLARVRRHSGKPLERIFIVGGGSRNWLLNRLTAKATGLRVVCGPAESSTIGNLAVQLAVLEGGHGSSTREFAEDVAGWAGTLHPLDGAAVCP